MNGKKSYGYLKQQKIDCPDIFTCREKILFDGIHCVFASKIDDTPYCIIKGVRAIHNIDYEEEEEDEETSDRWKGEQKR